MSQVTHLKSLQALECALREGSLKDAAEALGITPAALGQRIRALEDYLELDLLVRGRSGLKPTAELDAAVSDLHTAFDALARVSETLEIQRQREIHIVADPDWSELWLVPRLERFRAENPRILFCVNGAGDIPLRIGTPDIRIEYAATGGEELYTDKLLPVTGPDNIRRIANWDPVMEMEGMPLMHLEAHRDRADVPGWVEWFARYGMRKEGPDRGVYYRHARIALEGIRLNNGFLVCGLSLVLNDLETGAIVLPFSADQHLPAPCAYRMRIRVGAENQPQIQKFTSWLRDETAATARALDARTA